MHPLHFPYFSKKLQMGLIATDPNKILLYYDSNSSNGKQTYAYAAASEKEMLAIDIGKTKVPGSHWSEMAEKLGLNISELINKEHPDFINTYGKDPIELDEEGWLKLLDKSPQVLANPIVFIGETCIRVETPSQIVRHLESFGKDHTNNLE